MIVTDRRKNELTELQAKLGNAKISIIKTEKAIASAAFFKLKAITNTPSCIVYGPFMFFSCSNVKFSIYPN